MVLARVIKLATTPSVEENRFRKYNPPPPSRSENVLEPHSAEVIFEQLSEWDLLEVNVIETFYTIKP